MTDVSAQVPAATSAPANAPVGQAPLPAEANPVLSTPTLEDNLNAVMKTAPIIGTSPGLAVGVASSGGNTQARAQSLGRGVQAMSDSRAHQRVQDSAGNPISGALNWLGNHIAHAADDVVHPIEQGAKAVGHDAMAVLNKPLQVVQHEYRYLHDVEASHGMSAAIMEGIGIAAGAAAGTVAGGPWGGVLGAEAATGLEGHVFYKDSWARTGKASYVDPHTHQPVSLGRDVVSFLNDHGITDFRRGTKPFKVTSGLIDGLFDMSVGGPELGALAKATTGGERAAGLLGHYFIGTAPQTADDVYTAYSRYGTVQRAFSDLADKTGSQILATPAYEPLARDTNFLRALGDAQHPDEVANLFASAVQAQQLAFTRNLPTLAVTRVPTQMLREYAENANGPLGKVAKGFTRLPDAWNTVEGRLKEISRHEFDPASTKDNGALGLYRMLRYTESRDAAAAITDHYLNAPDLESRMNVYRNAQLNMIFKMGGFEGQSKDQYLSQFLNPNHREAMARVLDDLVGGGMFGRQAIYGLDDQGRILSMIQHGDGDWQYGAAILANQTGELRFLDPTEAKRAGKMLAGAQSIFDAADKNRLRQTLAGGDLTGRLGDFAYHHITQGIFKPLVLLTPSYAMHISLAELIPNMLRLGVHNLVRDGLALNIAKLGDKQMVYDAASQRVAAAHDELALAEQSAIPERIAIADEKLKRIQADEKQRAKAGRGGYRSHLDHAISGMAWRMLDTLSNHHLEELILHPGEDLADSAMGRRIQLAARYIEYNDGYAPSPLLSGHYSPTEIGQREEVASRLMRHAVGSTPLKLGDVFRQFGRGEHGFYDAYQAWLKEIAADPASRVGANALLDTLRNGITEALPITEEDVPTADFYHGSASPIRQLHNAGSGRGVENLYGPGFYVTDDKKVAIGYAKRGGDQGVIHGLRWKGGTQHFIDLEQPAPAALRDAIRQHTTDLSRDDLEEEFYPSGASRLRDLETALEDPHATGQRLFRLYKRLLADSHDHAEVDAAFRQLADSLSQRGFTGFKHIGGLNSRDGHLHGVHIVFNPERDLEITGRTQTRRLVNRTPSLDEASQHAATKVAQYLRELPEDEKAKFLRSNPGAASLTDGGRPYVTSFVGGLPAGMDQYDDWARVIVANLRGATHGADGTLHVPLLDHIANADGDFPETLWYPQAKLKALSRDSLPAFAKGQEIVPDGTATIQRLANVGFRRVLNPMVNFLSRQPIAFAEFEKQWAHLAPAVEHGQLAEDEAMSLAMSRTTQNVIRNVHNIHDRTQWSETLRNWVPFYFAQEQAYRRFGRLLAENPAAFRRYELMIANVHDVGQIFQGPNGKGYFVVPGTGWMTRTPVAIANTLFGNVETSTPIGMGWNLGGMNVIFPLSNGVRPDLGPLASVPVQAIATMFPELGAPALKAQVTAGADALLGPIASNQDLLSQLIPNTIAQRFATAGGIVDRRSFMSTMMQTLQTMSYEQDLAMSKWTAAGHAQTAPGHPQIIPDPDAGYMKWQQFIDRVKNQTRVMYTMKALVGAVTPVSPEITDTTYDKFSGALSKDIQATGSLTKGVQHFLSKNPDATPFTVFQSYSPTGATPPTSVEAENWINAHQDFIDKHPYSAFYFMPQLKDNKYNATVYNEQLAQGYRVKRDPEANPVGNIGSSFLAQLYIAAGNSYIYDNPDNYPTFQHAMKTMHGEQKHEAYLHWENFIQSYSAQNPVWGAYYGADTKAADRSQAIKEVRQIIANGELPNPDSKQSKGIVALMGDYDRYEAKLQAGVQNGFAIQSKSQIDQGWYTYLTSVAHDYPELRAVISGLFHSLPTSMSTTAPAAHPAGATANG